MVWGGRREEGSGWGAHVYLWENYIVYFFVSRNTVTNVTLKTTSVKSEAVIRIVVLLIEHDSVEFSLFPAK